MSPLRTINAMSMQEFSESLGADYESSRWVAERASTALPFDSVESQGSGFKPVEERASEEEQGALTKQSRGGQSWLALDRSDEVRFAVFVFSNRAYRQRFGFRLKYRPEQEWRAVFDEIHWVVWLRLEALVQEGAEA